MDAMTTIWVIEGYMPAFYSYEEAVQFVKWYNTEYFDRYHIELSAIKKRYLYRSVDDAI